MQNIITTVLSPLIVGIAQSVLKSFAQSVWDAVWSTLIDAVRAVEIRFKNNSDAKKEQVVSAVMAYIEQHKKLSKIQLWAVRNFIGKIIDRMIDDMNKNYGHSWVQFVTNLKNYWAGRIPYID